MCQAVQGNRSWSTRSRIWYDHARDYAGVSADAHAHAGDAEFDGPTLMMLIPRSFVVCIFVSLLIY